MKVDGEEMEDYFGRGQESHSFGKWDSSKKNVSIMSGNDVQNSNVVSYTPDIKIKNLVYENLLKSPEWSESFDHNGIWKEKIQ